MPLYEQHRSLTAAAWRSVVLERFLRSQSAPAIAKLQVRRTRSEKVQAGGNGVQGALEGANRVVGDMVRCKGATNIIHAACALLRRYYPSYRRGYPLGCRSTDTPRYATDFTSILVYSTLKFTYRLAGHKLT